MLSGQKADALISQEDIKSYSLILGGTGTRMVLALAYFLFLVNLLSLSDYGIFISLVASAMIIGNGGAYGYLAPTFRALTEKSDHSGAYIGSLIIYAIVWLPISLGAGVLLHAIFFHNFSSLQNLLLIILAETVMMRVLDVSYNLNIARGRHGNAAIINTFSALPRLVAVLLFSLDSDNSLSNWVIYFFVANIVAMFISLCLFPPVRLRFSLKIFRDGLREAFSLEGVNFMQSVQMELDKILVLVLAGPQAAGIYGLSMRIIYVVNEPIRSVFPLIAKFFIGNQSRILSLQQRVLFEAGLIISSLAAYGSILMVLKFWPDLLGANVRAGYEFFSMLPLVFALKLLPEYHKTVLYGAKLLHLAFIITFLLTAVKSVALALIASNLTFFSAWLLPINLLFLVLYLQSLGLTWIWAIGSHSPQKDSI